TVDPASAEAFEAAVRQAKPLFLAAEGCQGMRLERVIEVPGRYLLRVDWDSVEAHMDVFRNAPAFQEWRALAGPFFTEPPQVVHSAQVV
ncbi:MAG: antibiotic biosynthesis monooxygenase, partial [Alphaproteobacteria bacterium]|nr:antibiotic biosynthesis monooxygenase [Alphaproteobacteria bacterium]